MAVAGWSVLFLAGVAVSLGASWLLVSRLERLGERAGLSDALLGVVAALAADAPEITSAVTALEHKQAGIGAGVVIGSNVFNLAALLGLGAMVAGRIVLHRRVVLLSGAVAVWVAAGCLLAVVGALSPSAGLLMVVLVLAPYVALLGMGRARLLRLPLPGSWAEWLAVAVHEEELEVDEGIDALDSLDHPGRADVRRGTWRDAAAAVLSLVVVVVASVGMERAATVLGQRFHVADIVTGGLILAVVTSLPNAVAAVYLAARGRGAAVLSTALNSNALNVAAGLLLPAAITGLGPRTGQNILVAAWYAGLTLLALAAAFRGRGLGRGPGALIIAGYLVFVGALLVSVAQGGVSLAWALVPALAVGIAGAVVVAWNPPRAALGPDGREDSPG